MKKKIKLYLFAFAVLVLINIPFHVDGSDYDNEFKGDYSDWELEHMKYDLNDFLSETGKISKKLLIKYSLS